MLKKFLSWYRKESHVCDLDSYQFKHHEIKLKAESSLLCHSILVINQPMFKYTENNID